MKVVVASENPVKIAAVRSAFSKIFAVEVEVMGVASISGVKDQPSTDKETLEGARNRSRFIKEKVEEADFWVGLEGGVEDKDIGMEMFAWMSVLSSDGKEGLGKTATALVPTEIADLIRSGLEMGDATDKYFSKTNTKHKEGLIGVLTGGFVDRQKYYEDALVMALIPFRG